MTKQNAKQEDNQKQDEEVVEKKDKHEEEIEDLKKRNEDLENQIKRVLADYQNLEKRSREERGHWIQTANKDLLLRFLPILDTLILASKHSEDKSLQVSIGQFLQALKDEGVEKIEAEGKEFNPHLMECIQTIDGEDGKVIDEVRAGYKLNDTVLRPAQVRVGKSASRN